MKTVKESTTPSEIERALHILAENDVDANAVMVLVINYMIYSGLYAIEMNSITNDKIYTVTIKEKTDAEIIRFANTKEPANPNSKGKRKGKNTLLH